jgi:hypothetical protein
MKTLRIACVSLACLSGALTACGTAPDSDEEAEAIAGELSTRPASISHSRPGALFANEGLLVSPDQPGMDRITAMGYGYSDLVMQADCSLALKQSTVDYRGVVTTKVAWTTKISGFLRNTPADPTYGVKNCYALMQTDGNFVIYGVRPDAPWTEARYSPIWATNTWGNWGAHLELQPDGNLVILASNGARLWASNTVIPQPAPPGSGGGSHPGCRYARTDMKCVIAVQMCNQKYVCDNSYNPREESDGWKPCGACFIF